jgi:ATP-dependent DNA helicase RecQ
MHAPSPPRRPSPTSRPRQARRPADAVLKKSLRENFGHSELRPGQREVIDSVLAGKHTLAIMPTGAGKSLCYQLPALEIPGTTIVVSPLIALMKDQSEKLEDAGMDAEEVNSTLNENEEAAALETIGQAGSEFVFATPERMTDPEFLALLKRGRVSLFVIDEAHCISHWGHDFRPAYLQLGAVIAALGTPTVLALTATATAEVAQDIEHQLGLPALHVVNTGIYRPNLHYRVLQVTGEQAKLALLLEQLHEIDGPGIVYAATVKAVEEVFEALQQAGQNATYYHGQMGAGAREGNQDLFMNGAARIMVATNAFGMGIDKPDLRFVIHYQIPANLQAYYQESGRAGRDGADAQCVLLFHRKDRQVQQFFLARRYPGIDDLFAVYRALRELNRHGAARARSVEEALDQVPAARVQVSLKLLEDGGLIEQDAELRYRAVARRAGRGQLDALAARYRDKSAHDHAALERMMFYAQTGFCRWKVLLEQFGEEVPWSHCGHCDNCLDPPERHLAPEHLRNHAPAPAPTAAPEAAVGAPVRVPKYGEGRVVGQAGEKVTVEFPDSSRRVFLREYVRPAGGA